MSHSWPGWWILRQEGRCNGRVENAHNAVSADQVAAIRAYLSGDGDGFRRLNRMLYRSRERERAYRALIICAFSEAIFLRFSRQTSRNEVIAYVADLRSRSDNVADAMDPENAERLIMAFIADEDIDDLSGDECIGLGMILMAGFIADARLSAAQLDAFLEKCRTAADALLA